MQHDVWYDRSQRMWVSRWKDAAGNQIAVEWFPSKALAAGDTPPATEQD